MVSLADSRSFRLDSCWRVEVVNGGDGFRVTGFSSNPVTVQVLPLRFAVNAFASTPLRTLTFFPANRLPVLGSKSAPVATFTPSTVTSFESNSAWLCASNAFKSQYCADLKARRWRSFITNNLTATDWTLPADNPPAIFRHNNGESVYPTNRSRMRRVSWAWTICSSISRQFFRAFWIASLVISWNTIRFVGTLGLSSCNRCQLILSPSRSSSVARISSLAPLSAVFNSWTILRLSLGMMYSGANPDSTLIPKFAHFCDLYSGGISSADGGKSRTCPIEAFTT